MLPQTPLSPMTEMGSPGAAFPDRGGRGFGVSHGDLGGGALPDAPSDRGVLDCMPCRPSQAATATPPPVGGGDAVVPTPLRGSAPPSGYATPRTPLTGRPVPLSFTGGAGEEAPPVVCLPFGAAASCAAAGAAAAMPPPDVYKSDASEHSADDPPTPATRPSVAAAPSRREPGAASSNPAGAAPSIPLVTEDDGGQVARIPVAAAVAAAGGDPGTLVLSSDGVTVMDAGGKALVAAGGEVVVYDCVAGRLVTKECQEVTLAAGPVPLVPCPPEVKRRVLTPLPGGECPWDAVGLYLTPAGQICSEAGAVFVRNHATGELYYRSDGKLVVRDERGDLWVHGAPGARVVAATDAPAGVSIPMTWADGSVVVTQSDGVSVAAPDGRVLPDAGGRVAAYDAASRRVSCGGVGVTLTQPYAQAADGGGDPQVAVLAASVEYPAYATNVTTRRWCTKGGEELAEWDGGEGGRHAHPDIMRTSRGELVGRRGEEYVVLAQPGSALPHGTFGKVVLHPDTRRPIRHPDGSAVVSNPLGQVLSVTNAPVEVGDDAVCIDPTGHYPVVRHSATPLYPAVLPQETSISYLRPFLSDADGETAGGQLGMTMLMLRARSGRPAYTLLQHLATGQVFTDSGDAVACDEHNPKRPLFSSAGDVVVEGCGALPAGGAADVASSRRSHHLYYLLTHPRRPVVRRRDSGLPLVWLGSGCVCHTAVDRETVLGPDGRVLLGPDGRPLHVDDEHFPVDSDGAEVFIDEAGVVHPDLEKVLTFALHSEVLTESEVHNARVRMNGGVAPDGAELAHQAAALEKALSAEVGRLQQALCVADEEGEARRALITDEGEARSAATVAWALSSGSDGTSLSPQPHALYATPTPQARRAPPPSSLAAPVPPPSHRMPLPRSGTRNTPTPSRSVQSLLSRIPPTPLGYQTPPSRPAAASHLKVGETVALLDRGEAGGCLRADEVGVVIEIDTWCDRPYLVRGPRGDAHWYRGGDVVRFHTSPQRTELMARSQSPQRRYRYELPLAGSPEVPLRHTVTAHDIVLDELL